jgi:MOSC domain-containing protein YiiM
MGRPRIVGLYTAASAGAPVESHASVELTPGVGIVGDRYARRRGYWSDPRWPDQEVTLIEAETAAALQIEAGYLRRNLVTQDIDLAALIGVSFQIGEAELLGVRPCDPCRHLEELTRSGVAVALAGRGGLRAKVLRGGRVALGDAIMIAAPAQLFQRNEG